MASTLSRPDAASGHEPGAALHEVPHESATTLALTEDRIATVVSAAWELELVIAGGVTFALFQLPSSLDTARVWLEARAAGLPTMVLVMGYVYVKLMVYVLLGAFLLNLTARAYWVGLVGLHSVFPRGIDWEKPRIGPAARDVYRERLASLPTVIGRVDNFASIIFSFAFLIVVVVLFSLVGACVFGGLSWGLNALFFGGRHSLAVFEALAFGFAIPLAALGVVDKMYGPRWPAESVAGRRLRRLTRIAARINGTATFGPIFLTLFTNLRRRVMMTLFYGVFVGGLVLAMLEFFLRIGAVSTGTPRYVPDDESMRGVASDFYESLRGPTSETDVPTIQSDVIEGPYVRLFIPYLAQRHDPALTTSCPGARPQRPGHIHLALDPDDRPASERSADAALACLARLHAITLDGVVQPGIRLRFYRHPTTGRQGMIAYLPTASLAVGPHTLTVLPPPRAPTSRRLGQPLTPYEIPFVK